MSRYRPPVVLGSALAIRQCLPRRRAHDGRCWTARALGHHLEEEWEHQVVIMEKQLAQLHRSPTAVIDAVVTYEKLLGLANTTMTHRMTVYGEFLTMTLKCPYVVVVFWMPTVLLGARAKEIGSRGFYEPVDGLSLGLGK